MPNSPVSLTSPLSFSTWHADYEPPSPAYTRFPEPDTASQVPRRTSKQDAAPPVPQLPTAYRTSALVLVNERPVGQPAPPTFSDDNRSVKSWKSSKTWLSGKSKKGKKSKPKKVPVSDPKIEENEAVLLKPEENRPSSGEEFLQTKGTEHLQAILDLQMGPNCLAVLYNSHESGICQIYDAQGNEVSYTFGGIDHFKSLYEQLDEGDTVEEPRGPWQKMKGWSRKVNYKLNWSRRKTYMIEVWTLKARRD